MEHVLELETSQTDIFLKECERIRNIERIMVNRNSKNTHNSTLVRKQYVDEDQRLKLRESIVHELLTEMRLDDDDDIELGRGGLRWEVEFAKERILYLLTGLPASGKSSVAVTIAKQSRAIIVDSDYAKRKLPEFQLPDGSTLVHKESQMITEGILWDYDLKDPTVLANAIDEGYNVVLPKIGADAQGIDSIIEYFQNVDYSVYLVHVQVSPATATKRAYSRFLKSGRYIPLNTIYDGCGFGPLVAFWEIREMNNNGRRKPISGYIHLSTEGEVGSNVVLEQSNCKNVAAWLVEPTRLK